MLCKVNTGSVLVLRALSSMFLAVTEKHVLRLVMISHSLTILVEQLWVLCKVNTGSVLVLSARSAEI